MGVPYGRAVAWIHAEARSRGVFCALKPRTSPESGHGARCAPSTELLTTSPPLGRGRPTEPSADDGVHVAAIALPTRPARTPNTVTGYHRMTPVTRHYAVVVSMALLRRHSLRVSQRNSAASPHGPCHRQCNGADAHEERQQPIRSLLTTPRSLCRRGIRILTYYCRDTSSGHEKWFVGI